MDRKPSSSGPRAGRLRGVSPKAYSLEAIGLESSPARPRNEVSGRSDVRGPRRLMHTIVPIYSARPPGWA